MRNAVLTHICRVVCEQMLSLEEVTGLDFPHIYGATLRDLSVLLPTLTDGLYVTAPQLKRLCVRYVYLHSQKVRHRFIISIIILILQEQ